MAINSACSGVVCTMSGQYVPGTLAAPILAAVEGRHLPAGRQVLPLGMAPLNAELTATPTRESAGQDAPDASGQAGRPPLR